MYAFTDNIYRKMSAATIISDNFLKFVDFHREISKRLERQVFDFLY